MNMLDKIRRRLNKIYGDKMNDALLKDYLALLDKYKKEDDARELWNEKDVFLITYGDSLRQKDQPHLQTLYNFVDEHLKEAISIVHVLPFFPYSSDGGFSVIDFKEVNSDLGTWEDIQRFTKDYRVMADLVVNHISASSEWYQQFKAGELPGKDYIYTVGEDFDHSMVVRPRSSPLLMDVETPEGTQKVWTTFSEDQIDLNYANPKLMLAMLDVLLSYVEKGISIIRLDAIAFLWKRSGSSCVHEEETHEAVKLMRDVLDYCAPGTILLTETNVPHKENISYFGNGDEAHMVYQFSLPPLLLHALHTGNSAYLNSWARTTASPGKNRTYFNFTASHDGIGVRPIEGLMPEDEKEILYRRMKEFGGQISTRRSVDGKDVPYEINITYYDALKGTMDGKDQYQNERFLASQMILMALQGIPAIYIHSFLGTHNYKKGFFKTSHNRDINRRRWKMYKLEPKLADPKNDHAIVLKSLVEMLALRRQQRAFHPNAEQRILRRGNGVFLILRQNMMSGEKILAMTNVTAKAVKPDMMDITGVLHDLITRKNHLASELELAPYQTMWLVEGMIDCTLDENDEPTDIT